MGLAGKSITRRRNEEEKEPEEEEDIRGQSFSYTESKTYRSKRMGNTQRQRDNIS